MDWSEGMVRTVRFDMDIMRITLEVVLIGKRTDLSYSQNNDDS